jgi:hypothetical protein
MDTETSGGRFIIRRCRLFANSILALNNSKNCFNRHALHQRESIIQHAGLPANLWWLVTTKNIIGLTASQVGLIVVKILIKV